jgi:hypothetical protein
MSVWLVIVWCIGASCERTEIPVELGYVECALAGQLKVIEWRQQHPDLIVQRWGCQLGDPA